MFRLSRTITLMSLGLGLATASALAIGAMPPLDRQDEPRVLALLDRTSRDARQFDHTVDLALGRNPDRPVNPTPIEDDVDQFVSQLIDTTQHLRDHYTRRQVITTDVEEVLTRGARIDEFMRRNRLASAAQTSWLVVRGDLDELARTFHVDWNWTSPRLTPSPGPALYLRWSGTFELDPARSDDARRVAGQATSGLEASQRQHVEQNLINRLEAPQAISLDRSDRTVSIASSKAPRSTFDIDGIARTETSPAGNPVTVRASFYGDQLMVTTTGYRGNDFTVTFEPLDGGRTLLVTRRLDAMGVVQPVEAHSYYRRVSDQADWNVYHAMVPAPPPPLASVWLVPNRTVLVGRLNTPLGNRTSHQGDRFSLTVQQPAAYRGAVIDGIVSRVNTSSHPGRFDLIFDFDRIRLHDGQAGEFAGVLSQVRAPDGTTISIDTTDVLRADGDRGDEAFQRGAVGATFGAIIGAIAGGGKGAAIGAAIGAGAGAGSVFAEGHDLYLPPGTEVTVIATAPRR
jgi:hypothetical protein